MKTPKDTDRTKERELTSKPNPPEINLNSGDFSEAEQKKIVEMIIRDLDSATENEKGWIGNKVMDLKHYNGEKPSVLEGTKKAAWQSDRNLGLCAAVCDAYQASILQTCWNPTTIHFVPTEVEKSHNKQNLEKFAKWMVGRHEMNFFPEIDDYIHNRITQGFSIAEVKWKVYYEWVDERILEPEKNKYKVETKYRRFERAEIKNIANLEDIKFVDFGNDIQDLPFIVHVWHKFASEIWEGREKDVYKNVTKKWLEDMRSIKYPNEKETAREKAEQLGELYYEDITDLRDLAIDIYVWYGWYEHGGRREKYRFVVEPQSRTFLSGTPLRKITRRGEYPFVGGPLIRIPGHIRGKSIPSLISSIVNAFNNVFNQKSDFQYVTNCPFGFYSPAASEGYVSEKFELTPMTLYPVEGKPTDSAYIPNLARSMAWAVEDINILMELLERLTGAASFFMSNQRGVSGTATRDVIIQEKAETRFGKWIMRMSYDITELINMSIGLYQDWAPPKLGDRILNDEGQQVIRNFSINSIYGQYTAHMSPDFINGSKTMAKEVALWGFQSLSQTLWLDPRINPVGNWNLVADTAKKIMGIDDPERYLGREPKDPNAFSLQVDEEWSRFLNGEDFDPIEGENPIEHFQGHMRQKEEKYYDLDKEYRPIFDKHLTKTVANFVNYLRKVQEQQMANTMAMGMIQQRQQGGQGAMPMGQPPTPTQPAGGSPEMTGSDVTQKRPHPKQMEGTVIV